MGFKGQKTHFFTLIYVLGSSTKIRVKGTYVKTALGSKCIHKIYLISNFFAILDFKNIFIDFLFLAILNIYEKPKIYYKTFL